MDAERLMAAARLLLSNGTGDLSTLDPVDDLDALADRIAAIDSSFTRRRPDAMAFALPFLDLGGAAGTGPFVVIGREGDAVILESATPSVGTGADGGSSIGRIRIIPVASSGAVAMLVAGSADWAPDLSADAVQAIGDGTGTRIASRSGPGFLALTFNLRADAASPFADRRIRQALAMCIDIPATVAVATDGEGIPVSSDIPAGSWANPTSGISTYPVDQPAARALIEQAGWSSGADGVYERDGERLGAVIPFRDGIPARAAWIEAASEQARGCGFDLVGRAVPFAAIRRMLGTYPHVNAAEPDGDRPFEIYFGGHAIGVDPDPFDLYHSSRCSNAEQPDGSNVGCYADPAVDRLIEAGRRTTDLTERAAIQADIVARTSEDLPLLPIWSDRVYDGLGAALGTTAPGGFVLDEPGWYEPVESLTISR
jgi:peptide/nickel transport system substrate-binding protein